MKKAVVIGALGFVGYGLCCRLLDEGVFVYAVDLYPKENSQKEEKMLRIGRNSNFQFIDIQEEDRYNHISTETDVSFISLLEMNDTAKEGQEELGNVIQFCERSGSKLVILTSHQIKNNKLIDYINDCSFHSYLINLPMIYGPWQPNEACFQRAIMAEMNNKEFTICAKDFARNLLYIDDAVEGIIQLTKESEPPVMANLTNSEEGHWTKGLKLILQDKFERLEMNQEDEHFEQENTLFTEVKIKGKISLEEGIKKQYEHAKWLNNFIN
ncbi:NAD(P)-dependent oxidoreductase [Bacillus sp. PS06]|uniref:NAD(P)-dependent oxidoreductase n=1 Tax=Bacillus sp. PS06 TaxID=2764176 RepID=UPI00177B6736|nr:NAD(P)-dependent oxidoreductase [Bacillus sp. PS06]MBD8067548.1 NAD(P)-dependent oxidoreductase [Bacillus sp. PS06]